MYTEASYLGFRLPHPFVAGASPFGHHLDTIKQLEDAGWAAVVLHSLFEEQITAAHDGRIRHMDPLDPSFAERVALVGDLENLRQLYLARGSTCVFSPAEILVALEALEDRVTTGEWGDTSPEALNARAAAYPDEHRRVYNFWIPIDQDRWASLPPAFTAYEPAPLPRTYPF